MPTVIEDLQRWGPEAKSAGVTLSEANSYCRELATTHYENFPILSWFLPRHLRQHFANVYAFCRWADDLGDETGDRERSLKLLTWWRTELERCYAGEAQPPVYVALKPTIEQYAIPQQPFTDLIDAFVQDQQVRRYDTFDQLHEYCRRSANPVGRIVLHLCENVDDQTLRWSDSICTGLQLANFWQDVARDFDMGRVYLPAEDRHRFGYSDDDLQRRLTNDAFVKLLAFEVERSRKFLIEGEPLIKTMRGRMQIVIEMFLRGGLQILDEVERIGFRVWETRPIVRKSQIARLTAGCLVRALRRPGGLLRSRR